MTAQEIFICPGMGGYKFNPSMPQCEPRLLSILQPSSYEIRDTALLVPMFRADWLRELKLIPLPRRKIVLFVGFRVTALQSEMQRGGGSIWGVATVNNVNKTPTSMDLVDPIDRLVEIFISSLRGTKDECKFSNNSHLEIFSSIDNDVINSAYLKLRCFRQSGLNVGPFQRKP